LPPSYSIHVNHLSRAQHQASLSGGLSSGGVSYTQRLPSSEKPPMVNITDPSHLSLSHSAGGHNPIALNAKVLKASQMPKASAFTLEQRRGGGEEVHSQREMSINEIEGQLRQFQAKYEVLLREIDTNRSIAQ
jgi:hypothetical protein